MENNVIDDLMAMAEVDPQEIQYVRSHISPELNEKYDDETLQYIIDVLFEYIDQKDEEEEIIVDDVAQYVVAMAVKEKMGQLDVNEVAEIVDVDFDYMDSVAED